LWVQYLWHLGKKQSSIIRLIMLIVTNASNSPEMTLTGICFSAALRERFFS
jgi:hypothetical protein